MLTNLLFFVNLSFSNVTTNVLLIVPLLPPGHYHYFFIKRNKMVIFTGYELQIFIIYMCVCVYFICISVYMMAYKNQYSNTFFIKIKEICIKIFVFL